MSPWHDTVLCRGARGTSGAPSTVSGSCEVLSVQSSVQGGCISGSYVLEYSLFHKLLIGYPAYDQHPAGADHQSSLEQREALP